MRKILRVALFAPCFTLARASLAQSATAQATGYDSVQCPSCAAWNKPHAPTRIFGNVYYVGTDGLSAVLITSPQGHVLLDGGLPESAPVILANIATLGFKATDIKLIVNSHDHYDHAGGIAALQRASGARVAASASSAAVLRAGMSQADDPQFALLLPYAAVPRVDIVADNEMVRVGTIELTARSTPGHTPGGTTWTWRSCDGARCLDMVYADSQTPVSDDTFRYSGDARYPTAASDFMHGFSVLETLSCDILITPHPSASRFWERMATSARGTGPTLVDRDACKRFAQTGRDALAKRLAAERGIR